MCRVRDASNEFVCSIYYDLTVPESKRQQAAAFFSQVNEGLTRGHFEMDMQDSQVCFSIGVAGADHPLTTSAITQVVESGLATAEHYLPGLLAVIGAEEPPKGALARAQGVAV